MDMFIIRKPQKWQLSTLLPLYDLTEEQVLAYLLQPKILPRYRMRNQFYKKSDWASEWIILLPSMVWAGHVYGYGASIGDYEIGVLGITIEVEHRFVSAESTGATPCTVIPSNRALVCRTKLGAKLAAQQIIRAIVAQGKATFIHEEFKL